jgi:H+/Cl- antiporter ClcA
MLRSRSFVVLLVFAAVIGVVVSLASWAFLELINQIQIGVFTDLPGDLGFNTVPWWWPLPVLFLAGFPVAFAIARLPGNGGHIPANGLQMGTTEPNMVPGVVLAALATIGLGLVLGPEAPLIALGGGLAVFSVNLAKKDAPPQLLVVLGAAGAFAAISAIFGSPIVAAILVIEAAGLGGATLPLIVLPGLMAAGIGSLVFIGMGDWTGLSTSAYSLTPLHLSAFSHPTWGQIGWAIVIGLAAAVVTIPVRRLGLATAGLVPKKPFVIIPLVGLVVATLAIVFDQITDKGVNEVLFSGQSALPGFVANAGAWSLGTLGLLFLCKGLAWSLCLGAFRGGPTFPAMFLGVVGGIAATHLPGMPSTVGIAVGMAAMIAAVLKLPLSAIIIAGSLTFTGGTGLIPLIIVGVVVSYLATLALEARLETTPAAVDVTTAAADSAPPGSAR